MLQKNIKDIASDVVIYAILSLALLYVGSYFAILYAPKIGIFTYANFWFPLISSLEKIVFCFVLGWKVIKFESCLLTKLSVGLFALLSVLSILYCVNAITYAVMLNIVTIAIPVVLILMCLGYIIKKIIKKYEKK